MAKIATLARHQVAKKLTRMNIRTTEIRKATYEHAAELRGVALTTFVEATLDAEAERVIAEAECIELTTRDWQFLMDFVRNPAPEPNRALLTAAEDLRASRANADPAAAPAAPAQIRRRHVPRNGRARA
jgi:uncharacterized protein (DUF1778 family)